MSPFVGGSLILALSQALTLFIAFREKEYVEANQLASPQISAGFPLAYFFGVVLVFGVVLFLVPLSKLKVILRIMFAFLFAWGTFIVMALILPLLPASFIMAIGGKLTGLISSVLALILPVLPALLLAACGGLVWLITPRVWLHNLLLVMALVSTGAVFGFLVSPWTAIVFMLVISVYDVLAVRFGYMVWMAKRLSETETLPAFIMPKKFNEWNLSLRGPGFGRLFEEKDERDFSILGGGDVGLPLLLTIAVFFAYGFLSSVIVAVFTVLGLAAAYGVQRFWLKGKPTPALPPIAVLSLIGFLVVRLLVESGLILG